MIMNKYPEPTVGALIFNSKGEILLIKSYKWKDMFVMPGGHIEVGETMEQALKREIKEETGLDIFDIKFLCFWEYIFGDGFIKNKHFIFFDFLCRTNSSEVKLNKEGQEFIWISPEKAMDLKIESYTKKTIKQYLKNTSL